MVGVHAAQEVDVPEVASSVQEAQELAVEEDVAPQALKAVQEQVPSLASRPIRTSSSSSSPLVQPWTLAAVSECPVLSSSASHEADR